MEINRISFRAKCCKAALDKIQNTAFDNHPEETLQYVYGIVDMASEIDELMWDGAFEEGDTHDN